MYHCNDIERIKGMSNYQSQNGIQVIGNRVIIDGVELPPAPCKGHSVTTINGKVYIDGYELIKASGEKH